MALNLGRYKKDIESLIARGERLLLALKVEVYPESINEEVRKALPNVRSEYQAWYSESLAAIRQLLPDRVEDFIDYYKLSKSPRELDANTYRLWDYLQHITVSLAGREIAGFKSAVAKLAQQVEIVRALKQRFESSLFDIRALAQADMFDNELDAADELNTKGFQRGAGAIAGVVLEGHLGAVCNQHKISPLKTTTTISQLNDLLKKHDVLDTATWRFVQHLGDLRNLCDHKKAAEPTKDQIHELIGGVRKIIKTVF